MQKNPGKNEEIAAIKVRYKRSEMLLYKIVVLMLFVCDLVAVKILMQRVMFLNVYNRI
jgi:hypothetical protein